MNESYDVATINLAAFNSDDLADELEKRGFVVYHDLVDAASDLTDDEIIEEYEDRNLQHFDHEQDAIDHLQSKGYSVYRTNEIEDIWHDIYTHALTLDRDRFMMWLNGQFMLHIERWI